MCGERTRTVDKSNRRYGWVRGHPMAYRQGHSPGSRANRLNRESSVRGGTLSHRREVPIERVQPLARWLVKRYGSARRAAEVSGLRARSLSRWASGGVRSVHPRLVKALAAAVLAHRRSRDPWRVFEVEPMLLAAEVRARIPEPEGRKARQARYSRRWRAGERTQRYCAMCGVQIGTVTVYMYCTHCRREEASLAQENQRRWGSGREPVAL
jgi:hypothetical protein